MAITWGAWEYAGGNGMRVGLEVTNTTPNTGSTGCIFTVKVYTQVQYTYSSDTQTLTYGGNISGTFGYTNNQGSGTSLLRDSVTHTYTYSTYGTSPGNRTFTATLSGAYNGVTPTVSVTVAIPARPYAAPDVPGPVTATRTSDTTATVAWTNNTSAQKPYTSKTLQMRTYNGSTWGAWSTIASPSAASTSQAVTGLSANRIYEFKIRANNTIGSSSYVAATSSVKMTPAAPTTVASARSGANIVTTWVNAAYTDSGVTWTVERSVAGGAYASIQTGIAQGTLTYTDAAPGVGTNQYRVKAVQATGSLSSAYGTGNSVSTEAAPLAPTLLAPNGLPVDLFNDGATLTWKHNDGGDGAAQTAFQVQFSNNGGSTWTALDTGTITSTASLRVIAAAALANGVAYQWRVRTRAVTAAGFGPYSTAATITASAQPVATITAPGATTTVLPLALTWTYSQDQSSPQAAWQAELVDSNGAVVDTASGTTELTATFDYPVADGEAYTVRVRVQSAAGLWGDWSSVATTIDLLPPAPTTLVAEYDICSGSVALTLTPDNPTPGTNISVDTVIVERKIDDGEWFTIATGVQVPITIIDTIPSTTKVNEYRVTSVSDLPSYYVNGVVTVQNVEGGPSDPLWAFLTYGDGFSKTLRLRGSLTTSADSSRARGVQHFMGRRLPSLLVGESVDRVVTVAGTAYYDERCDVRDACDFDSSRDDWEDAAWDAEVVCYRDHTGRRIFGMLSNVATDDVFPGVAGVGFSVTQSDYTELSGVTPTFGENLANPAWLLSNTGWSSMGFGYQCCLDSIAAEAGGLRLSWDATPGTPGNGYQMGARSVGTADGLVAGRRYRFGFRIVLAAGSDPVKAEIAFLTAGASVTAIGVPVDVWVDYTFTGSSIFVGLSSGPNPPASVLIQSMSIKERAI